MTLGANDKFNADKTDEIQLSFSIHYMLPVTWKIQMSKHHKLTVNYQKYPET